MINIRKLKQLSISKQLLLSIISTMLISAICFPLSDFIGYRTIALILLFVVSVQAMFFSVVPVLFSALLSALIWDFLFIPPNFTFHVDRAEDILMLFMFFTIALLNGILTSKMRKFEKDERLREQKLDALKLYNNIFNSISHELRTPITTIMGISENLLNSGKKLNEKDSSSLINEIIIASVRLNRIIDNLLNISRLETGFFKPNLDWCDINELIHTVVNFLKPEMKNYEIKLDIPEEIPLVKLDFGLIVQALHNILHNVLIHTPQGTKVKISVQCSNNQLEIIISDNGPGFSNEDIEMIFEKYYRSNIKKTGRLGLGLSITKGFITAHKGTIEVNNLVPSGAEFKIKIPVETTQISEEYEK